MTLPDPCQIKQGETLAALKLVLSEIYVPAGGWVIQPQILSVKMVCERLFKDCGRSPYATVSLQGQHWFHLNLSSYATVSLQGRHWFHLNLSSSQFYALWCLLPHIFVLSVYSFLISCPKAVNLWTSFINAVLCSISSREWIRVESFEGKCNMGLFVSWPYSVNISSRHSTALVRAWLKWTK